MKKVFYFILLLVISSCKDEKDKVEPAVEFQQLTNYPEGVNSVVISDDGLTVFYTVNKNRDSMGNYIGDLYSMNSDGSNQKKIANYVSNIGIRPILSKNSRQLAFTVIRNTNTSSGPVKEIFVGNFDGTGLRTLQPVMNGTASLRAFVDNDQSLLYNNSDLIVNGCACNTIWKLNINDLSTTMISGNGSAMAVSKDRSLVLVDNRLEAYAMDTKGQNVVQLGSNFLPWDISPDNSTIVMHKILPWHNGTNAVQIFISDANGTSNNQITNTEGTSLPHGFFPNGQEVLFSYYVGSSGQGSSELYSIRPDGTGLKQLTFNSVDEVPIGFLENSKKILVVIQTNGVNNIHVLNLK